MWTDQVLLLVVGVLLSTTAELVPTVPIPSFQHPPGFTLPPILTFPPILTPPPPATLPPLTRPPVILTRPPAITLPTPPEDEPFPGVGQDLEDLEPFVEVLGFFKDPMAVGEGLGDVPYPGGMAKLAVQAVGVEIGFPRVVLTHGSEGGWEGSVVEALVSPFLGYEDSGAVEVMDFAEWTRRVPVFTTHVVTFRVPDREGVHCAAVTLGKFTATRCFEVAMRDHAALLTQHLKRVGEWIPDNLPDITDALVSVRSPFSPLPEGSKVTADTGETILSEPAKDTWLMYAVVAGGPTYALIVSPEAVTLWGAIETLPTVWAPPSTGPSAYALTNLLTDLVFTGLEPKLYVVVRKKCMATMAQTLNPPFRGYKNKKDRAVYGPLPWYSVDVFYVSIPGTTWGAGVIAAEHKRVKDWYAQYCIDIIYNPLPLPAGPAVAAYQAWSARAPKILGFQKDRTAGRDALLNLNALIRAALPQPRFLLVIYGLRGVMEMKGVGKGGWSEASLNIPGTNTIFMHTLDSNDPFILAHELIHGIGRKLTKKNGVASFAKRISWYHSNNPICMSNLKRRGLAAPAGLNAKRLLDFAEYSEFRSSGQMEKSR